MDVAHAGVSRLQNDPRGPQLFLFEPHSVQVSSKKSIPSQARSGLTMNHVTTAGVHVGTQMLNRLYQPASATTNTTTVGAIAPPTTAAEKSAAAHAKLFAQDVQEYGAPKFSSLNPDGIRNNCVLVTLAYLMGLKNVNELNPQIQATFQAEQTPKGIYENTMLKILRLTGREFRYDSWALASTELVKKYAPQKRRKATELFVEWGVEEIAIWYQRPDGTGHCIVLKDHYSGESSNGHRIVMPGAFPEQYVDYQESSTGDDRWSEVRGDWLNRLGKERSVVMGAFALTPPQSV